MNTIQKRDYIHSHLHQVDENAVNDVFEKVYAIIENSDPDCGI
jgi:2,3-bisphosphoglycerate-independent phosphoglycerate mutase